MKNKKKLSVIFLLISVLYFVGYNDASASTLWKNFPKKTSQEKFDEKKLHEMDILTYVKSWYDNDWSWGLLQTRYVTVHNNKTNEDSILAIYHLPTSFSGPHQSFKSYNNSKKNIQPYYITTVLNNANTHFYLTIDPSKSNHASVDLQDNIIVNVRVTAKDWQHLQDLLAKEIVGTMIARTYVLFYIASYQTSEEPLNIPQQDIIPLIDSLALLVLNQSAIDRLTASAQSTMVNGNIHSLAGRIPEKEQLPILLEDKSFQQEIIALGDFGHIIQPFSPEYKQLYKPRKSRPKSQNIKKLTSIFNLNKLSYTSSSFKNYHSSYYLQKIQQQSWYKKQHVIRNNENSNYKSISNWFHKFFTF